MTKKQKKTLIRIIVAAALLIAGSLLPDIPVPGSIPLPPQELAGGDPPHLA